jgi:hypothetical protein
VKIKKRAVLLVALVGVMACSAALFASPASATFTKEQVFLYCVSTAPLNNANLHIFIGCCKFAGGTYEVTYDSAGNPTHFTCNIIADAGQGSGGPGLSMVPQFGYANPGTGIATSGGSSGGLSQAGISGVQQVVITADIIP